MRKVTLRVISFKQSTDDPVYLYGLSDNPITMGCYYYNRDLGKFAAIQRCLHEEQTKQLHPIIETTNNPKYDSPRIPEAFIKQYYDSNKTLTKLEMRL